MQSVAQLCSLTFFPTVDRTVVVFTTQQFPHIFGLGFLNCSVQGTDANLPFAVGVSCSERKGLVSGLDDDEFK